MTREEVIGELIRLKKKYIDTGENEATLWGHFGYEYDHGEVVWIEENDQVIAFADFSWVSSKQDIEDAYQGKRTTGHILHIINVVCLKPGKILELKRMLPQAEYVTGTRSDRFCAPKGWPLENTKGDPIHAQEAVA